MNKRRAILTAAGILSLCLLTAAQLIMPPPVEAVVSSIQPSPVNEHLQFAMLVFGIGALVYGLGGPPPLSTDWRGFIRRHGPIIAITLLALADLDDATFRAAALPLDALAVIVPTTYRNPQHADWLMRYLYSNDPYPSVAVMISETFINEMTAPRVLGGKPPGGYAFFIEQDDTQAQAALTYRFGPLPYEMSPYPVPEKTQFRMYRVR